MKRLRTALARPGRLAALAAAAVTLLGLAVPAPATADGSIPGVDEVVTSANVEAPDQHPQAVPRGVRHRPGVPGQLRLCRQLRRLRLYDISRPTSPRWSARSCAPAPRTTSRSPGTCCSCPTDSSRIGRLLPSASPARDREVVLGGHQGLRHQRQGATRATSPPSRPPCGSHTHTLVPGKRGPLLYVPRTRPAPTFPDCQPPHDGISVVKVPRKTPRRPASRPSPVLFPDGGNPGVPHRHRPASVRPPAATTSPRSRKWTRRGRLHGRRHPDGHLRPGAPEVLDRVRTT